VLSPSNDQSVNEGTTHTYNYTVTDPGQDTFSVDSGYPKCGLHGTLVGTPTTTPTGGSFQCSFPDGPNTTTVAIKVTDSDGASETASEAVQIVDVANVAPVVSAPANQSSAEGTPHTFSLGSFADPGSDAPWNVSVDWGDSSTPDTFTVNSDGSLGSLVHTYADGPSTHTVTVTVTDKDGASDSDTFSVTVSNVAPTVTFTNAPASANEGETKHYTYTVSDPGQDTYTVVTSCGVGGTKSNDVPGSFDCTFPDGPATPTVSAQATDSDGNAGNTATQSVTVNNVAPTVAFTSAPASSNEGQTQHYTYSISDPGQDMVMSVATSCGANGSLSNASNGNTSGPFDCTFPDGPASSNVTVQATDSDGDAGNTVSQTVSVANVAPTVAFTAAPYSANEGQTKTYTYTVTDPGQDPDGRRVVRHRRELC